MHRYKVTVSYCGASYGGWQRQINKISIQEIIENVISGICNGKIKIISSGRTDAKVNALGQCFHFDCDLFMCNERWIKAINGFLPADIRVVDFKEVSLLFHARYSVLYKQYDYCINLKEYNVFTRDFILNYKYKLDILKMKAASKYLVGYHDFTSFCVNPISKYPNQWREVFSIAFHIKDDILTISFKGRGFLRYMVRMMVAMLLEVGRGKIHPEEIKKLLDARSKEVVKKNIDACGLTLSKVAYFRIVYLDELFLIRSIHREDKRLFKDKKIALDNLFGICYRNSEELIGLLKVINGEVIVIESKIVISDDVKNMVLKHLKSELF